MGSFESVPFDSVLTRSSDPHGAITTAITTATTHPLLHCRPRHQRTVEMDAYYGRRFDRSLPGSKVRERFPDIIRQSRGCQATQAWIAVAADGNKAVPSCHGCSPSEPRVKHRDAPLLAPDGNFQLANQLRSQPNRTCWGQCVSQSQGVQWMPFLNWPLWPGSRGSGFAKGVAD